MNIFRELNRYARGSGDEQSLDKIFVYCNELAVNHINSLKLSSQLTAFQGSSNDCIKDQASNYLSHLWCPPDEQGLAPIAKIWKNILIKTNNHREDALFYLSNTIRDIVAKKRIEALRTSRPQEWKLRRNIRLIVGRLEHYSIARTDGKLLIVSKSNTGQEIVSISRKILERHCYRLFEGTDSLTDLVIKATKILSISVVRGNAIIFEELANLITEFNVNIMALEKPVSTLNRDMLDRVHLRNLLAPVFSQIRTKIFASYVNKGKLRPEMAEIYLKALKVFLDDLMDSGSTDKQFIYLADQLPQLKTRDFNKEHKARFGYLVSELRAMLEEYVSEILISKKNVKKEA